MNYCSGWIARNYPVVALLALFMVIGGAYSVITPLFEASDELWHYPMVKTLADGNVLPVQDPTNPGPWRQEGSQPPLYYALCALATFWIDTSDIDAVRRLNPHADNGIPTADGNINLITHNTEAESWPWRGTTLAAHLARFVSVAISTGTVLMTYCIGRELFATRRWLSLAGAGAVAFNPMFAFISGSVNNDNLAIFLATLSIWLMLRIVQAANVRESTLKYALWLGATIGLAALSKQSTLGLLGLAGLTMAYTAWRARRWQVFFLEGPLIVMLVIAIAGWWYYRNWQLYGDLTGLNVFLDVVGRRSPPASMLQLWGERDGFMRAYWGFFGGVNVPMPEWAYHVLNTVAILSIPGVFAILFQIARRQGWGIGRWATILLSLLWIPGVAIPLVVGWARFTLASQGRLVFAAISVISLWLMAGLSGWLPSRFGRAVAAIVLGFMGVLTIGAPLLWIRPAYALEFRTEPPLSASAINFTPPGADEPTMRLLGYDLQTASIQPGEAVQLTLYWESLARMDRNWSVFVHLQDSASFVPGQRDTYPGLGLIATTDLQPGQRWVDTYVVPVSPSAYAPETLTVNVGLYDLNSGQRMLMADGTNSLTLGQVELLSRVTADGIPNPVSFNFGGEVELVGYSLAARQVAPGQTAEITLYWRAVRRMPVDYVGSIQVLDEQAHKYGQQDNLLLSDSNPTTTWAAGEIVHNTWSFPVASDAPPGTYRVQVVVYWIEASSELTRLQRVTSYGALTDDFLFLTQLRVAP